MKKANQYQQEINQLKTQLNSSDSRYFEKLQTYILSKNIFYNDETINLQLLSMLQDLIDAEKDNSDATELFGNDPQSMANEILAQLPKPKLRDQLSMSTLVIAISWFFLLLSSTSTTSGIIINLWAFILAPFLELITISLILKILHKSVYSKSASFFQSVLPKISIAILFLLCVGLILLVNNLLIIGPTITLPTPWNFFLQGFILIATLSYFFYTLTKQKHKK